MKIRSCLLAVGLSLAAAAVAVALDTVKTTKINLSGRVVKMSPLEVEIEQGVAALRKQIQVNEIVTIFYDNEPKGLTSAREHLANGRYEDAVAVLERLSLPANARAEIAQDVEYFKAFAMAQIALGGGGDVVAAGREMVAFVNAQKGSYHWLKANEVVGDLLVAAGKFAVAEGYYDQVAKAPWPDYKMRAGVAIGRALLARGETAEARKAFDGVLAIEAGGELAQAQRMAATLGNARILALEKKPEEAIKAVEPIIQKADPEQADLLAQAYNTLGIAYRAAGRPKDALIAFLHVDLLYFGAPDAHAEALYNLVQLWEAERKTERAVQCRNLLEQRYKNSPWAQKGR